MLQEHMKTLISSLLLFALTSVASAQTVNVGEDFTGATTTNPWFSLNGACLTAGTGSSAASSTTAGSPPGCTANSYYTETLVGGYAGVSGSAKTLPDNVGQGALRFTNGCISGSSCSNGGHYQNGAIISGNAYSSSAGLQITFKTVTYRGDSYNGSGADGMSFFLMDGSVTPNIGSTGGSLGYSCSNSNADYHGMAGAYIGLGIDEFGNFLNSGDNTVSGPSYTPNRIGLRGNGSVNWTTMAATYSQYQNSNYSGNSSNQQNAVRYTCKTGYLSDYNGNAFLTGPLAFLGIGSKISVADYAAISGGSVTLPSSVVIGNEYSKGGYSRVSSGTNILMYNLTITPAGLLSLSYNVNGGAWTGVLSNQSITSSNGTIPSTIRFGFAGSTGGGSNIHEVLCFKAASLDASGSSAGSNVQQSSKVTGTTQAYFAYYNPNDWTGRLTANLLTADPTTGIVSIATAATWDASCVLTGGTCTATGATNTVEGPTSRVILSWSNATPTATSGAGEAFEWTSGITTAQQATLYAGDPLGYLTVSGPARLNYLRGDRSCEAGNLIVGLTCALAAAPFRVRDLVLGDIVDSSPVAVGQASSPYAVTWKDKLVAADPTPENTGQTYSTFYSAELTRENVVYVGANDGMLHGFDAGAYDSTNTFQGANNNGKELIAYMPGAVLNTIHSSSNPFIDYSNPFYGHNFYVDATPGFGDLYYGSAWHTWLVGGLGAGGAAIYALDITTPTAANFVESRASALVIGEWSAANITCPNVTNCALSLGNTYGTPVIRRLHNGTWAVIFGNGFGSTTGDAGIYVATINSSGTLSAFYYLRASAGTGTSATPCSSSCNGIAYVTPLDLDGDHITDYVYAGDLLGNIWRFDLTSGTVPTSSAPTWAAGTSPVFSAGSGHPITSAVLAAFNTTNSGTEVLISFGTGQQTQFTNTTATTYSTGTQAIYTVWDWNYSSWNAKSGGVQYASLSTSAFTGYAGASAGTTVPLANLTAQTLAINTAQHTVDITPYTICWAGTTTCTGTNKSFGWYANLPATQEQIIFNPELVGSTLVVNSVIPANNTVLSCTTSLNTGYTYAFSLATGGVSTTLVNGLAQNFFVSAGDTSAVGLLTSATGTSILVTTSAGGATSTAGNMTYSTSSTVSGTAVPNSIPFPSVGSCGAGGHSLVYQNSAGAGGSTQIAIGCPLSGERATWFQRR